MKILQIIDALDYGDGVSNSVINTHKLLNEIGFENYIYSKWANHKVSKYRHDINKIKVDKNSIVFYHFSGYSHTMESVLSIKANVVLIYHNVTPPDFFKSNNVDFYNYSIKGLNQLKTNIKNFKYFAADSEFNKRDLLSYGAKDIEILPIALDLDSKRSNLKAFNLHNDKIILAVGRIAPNKKYEDILDIYEEYFSYYNSNSTLICVGNTEYNTKYLNEIKMKAKDYNCMQNVIFTDKISNDDLYSHYCSSDIFLCMSEHEGFCLPLIEAMYFDIPVMAYNSCAVPYTMGRTGIIVNKKDPQILAGIIDLVLNDYKLRDRIVYAQRENVKLYLNDSLKSKLKTLIEKWSD